VVSPAAGKKEKRCGGGGRGFESVAESVLSPMYISCIYEFILATECVDVFVCASERARGSERGRERDREREREGGGRSGKRERKCERARECILVLM